MCVPIPNYYIGLNGAVAVAAELGVLLASFIATGLHFKASKGANSITLFHLAHSCFCLLFAVHKLTLLSTTPTFICQCDPFNILNVVYNFFYMTLWVQFNDHWVGVTRREDKGELRFGRLRILLYTMAYVPYAYIYTSAIFTAPCDLDAKNGWDYASALCLVVLAIDSWYLALLCLRRFQEHREASTVSMDHSRTAMLQRGLLGVEHAETAEELLRRAEDAAYQTSLFLMLSVSISIGALLTAGGSTVFGGFAKWGLIYVYSLPSIFMLLIMWKRNYISAEASLLEDPSWTENSFAEDSMRDSEDLLDSIDGPLGGSDRSYEIAMLSDQRVRDEIRSGLTSIGPLQSSLEFDLDNMARTTTLQRRGRVHSSGTTSGSPLLSSILALSPPPDDLELGSSAHAGPAWGTLSIAEDLRPSSLANPVTRLYILSVVLPLMERALAVHEERNAALVTSSSLAYDTRSRTLYGDLEAKQQHEELEAQCGALTARFTEFVQMLRLVAMNLPLSGYNGEGLFKPSRNKGSLVLGHVPTNLAVHSTVLTASGGGGGGEGPGTAPRQRVVTAVTFGAPSAHALGWATGGLRETIAKLKQSASAYSTASKARGPAAIAKQLELRFLAKARESIVLSQALAAAVTAAAEVLGQAIRDREGAAVRQMARAGLLLHSVSLLSTSGKELSMIDDMTAAYESMNLSLRLEAPVPAAGGRPAAGGALGEPMLEVAAVEPVSAKEARLTYGGGGGGEDHELPMGRVLVTLRAASLEDFVWLATALGAAPGAAASFSVPDLDVRPVLFNLGVNEMQTVANATGSVQAQSDVNRRGAQQLRRYYEACVSVEGGGEAELRGDLDQVPCQ